MFLVNSRKLLGYFNETALLQRFLFPKITEQFAEFHLRY